jgi:hypothetical protein
MNNKPAGKIFSALLSAAIWLASASLTNAQEPIAIIGHGSMFDHAGKEIKFTPEFVEKAQNYYLNELSAKLRPDQLKKYQAERARLLDVSKRAQKLNGQEPDRQVALVVNAALIDWLLKENPLDDAGELQGKNNLIKAKLRQRLTPPDVGAPYAPPKEVLELLGK